jgi:uridine phosphorylase
MSEPIITPKKFLDRDVLLPEVNCCTIAIIGFCRFNAMKSKLLAEPLSETLFSHLDKSHQFVGYIANHKILAVECLYGGPLSATVLEELAHYGIKTVIGYGYAGSLRRQLSIGQIVMANAAIVSDGTSHEYLPDEKMAYPDPKLFQIFNDSFKERAIVIKTGTVSTTDAIYREYPEKIEKWREAGADVVNMDTSYLYAISKVLGLSAIYTCVVSDCVDGLSWDEGFGRAKQAMGDLQDAIVATALKTF